MPKHATARIEDAEHRMKEPVSPENMERRKEVAARLLSLMDRPMSDEEKEFWRKFEADLEGDRS
jgi:hypothetical protein